MVYITVIDIKLRFVWFYLLALKQPALPKPSVRKYVNLASIFNLVLRMWEQVMHLSY